MKEKRKSHKLLSLLLCCAVLIGMMPMTAGTAFAADDTRPAPDRVQSYIAASGFTATALNPNHAKFTYVEITSNSSSDTDSGRSMKATVKCVPVDAAIAKKIGYNANATVNSEDQLSLLKTKLKASSDYHKPSDKTLSFPANSNAIRHQDIGKGTFRYLLSVEAYFNGTYYFDGAGINFETAYQGNGRYTVSVQVCGMTIYPDTASGEGDPPTKLKLVIDNQIGREFTNTNAAPKGNYVIENYPNTHVANFRWICMPNTNLEIELRNNTVLHVGKYFRSSSSSAEIKTNIHADNLTISGNGVLLASNFNNLPYGATGTAADSAIHANSLTVDSSNVVLDLTRDEGYNCIEVPTSSAFKPINAKSIKLAAASGKWISGLSNNEASLKNAYSAYWNEFPIESDSELRRVTFGRTATLGNPTLNVGGIAHSASDKNFEHVVSDAASKELFVSFDAGPQWFTTYYLKNKIKLNATVYIWEAGDRKDVTIVQSAGGRSDGSLNFTLNVRSLELKANKTYTVSLFVDPTMNGERLAGDHLLTQWTFRTVEQPEDKAITAVGLKQVGYRYTDNSGNLTAPAIDISGNNQPYTITDEGSWVQGDDSETYTRTVKLTPKEGYRFIDTTTATAVNTEGGKSVDGITKVLNEDGTLSVTITTYKRYTVKFYGSDDTHYNGRGEQYVKKGEKAIAPENPYEISDNKVFVGWKKNSEGTGEKALLPGEETGAITENTKYYLYTENIVKPEYRIEVEKTFAPAQTAFDRSTFNLTIRNTGTAATGDLGVTFRSNSGNYSMYYETYDAEETATRHDPVSEVLTIPSIPVGDSMVVCLELPEVTTGGDNSCAVRVQNTENGIDRSVIVKTTRVAFNTVEVKNGAADCTAEGEGAYYEGYVVTIRAREAGKHETFIGWTVDDTSPVQVVFSDPTAPVTQFVMPHQSPQITANFAVAPVNGIAVTTPPFKTVYNAGENFDPTGMVVQLTYTDETMEALPEGATLSYDPDTSTALTAGISLVKISYTPEGEGSTPLVTYLPITVNDPLATTYTVTYNANGGTGMMASDEATAGVPFTLPTCTFTPKKESGKTFTFEKWQIGDDTTTYYQPGQSVTINANTTITAIWKELSSET